MSDCKSIPADAVVKLLAAKHAEDLFVPECKDGPSQSGTHLRLDAWAMNRSWSNACVSGYEVKVSRSDFLRDDKWRGYLPMCNQFYWVCPQGLIQISEVSDEAGLMYVTANGGRLFTKKRAPYRDVQIPQNVWRYILMCRAKIGREHGAERESSQAYWDQWLQERKEGEELGHRVAYKITEHVRRVERKSGELVQKMGEYDDIRSVLAELGWKEADREWVTSRRVKDRVGELGRLIPPNLIYQLEQLSGLAKTAAEALQDAQKLPESPL